MNRVMPRSQVQTPAHAHGIRHVEDSGSQVIAGAWQDGGKGKGKGKGSYAPYYQNTYQYQPWYGQDKGKGKGKQKGKGKGKGKGYSDKGKGKGKGGKSHGWNDGGYNAGKSSGKAMFMGYCGGCWQWGHKKADCPAAARPHVDGVSKFYAASSDASSAAGSQSPSNASTRMTSAGSYHIGAVASRGIEIQDDGDWYCGDWDRSDECIMARMSDMGMLQSWPEDDSWEYSDDVWYDSPWPQDDANASWYPEAAAEGSWVCSIGRNPDAVKELMIDSGSQSTAVSRDFAPEYEVDDSEIPVLWDISEQPIKAYGRKLVRCEFVMMTTVLLKAVLVWTLLM